MSYVKIKRALVQAAEEQILETAESLKACHTIGGEWPEDEKDAKEEYEYMLELADKLREAL